MEKIDILMAVYNGERFIAEQVESILNQTYKNIHLTIRDNCSTDNTKDVIKPFLEKHPDKITWIESSKNLGIVGNFSALLNSATSNYMMFCDHDDVWLPEKIEKSWRKMKEMEENNKFSTPLLIHTDLRVVNTDLQTIHESFWKYAHLDPFKGQTLPRLFLQNQVTGCTIMINKALKELSCPIPDQVVMHDWWLALNAAAFGNIGIINEATILYRQHGNNDTGAKRYSLMALFKNFLNKNFREKRKKNRELSLLQAERFLVNNRAFLPPSTCAMIEAFIEFDEAIFLRKAILMFRYGFYRVGFFRNLCLLFGLRNLRKLMRNL